MGILSPPRSLRHRQATPRQAPPAARARRRKTTALLAAAIFVTAVLLFPLYWMAITSVSPTSATLSRSPPLVPSGGQISLSSYVEVLTLRPILRWLVNSSIVTVGSVAINVVVSSLAGYSLSRLRTRGQQAMGYGLLLARMLPGTLLVIPLFLLFNLMALTNSLLGLILANVTVIVPFSCWMMKGFFDSIPRELEEAALVDGCTRLGALRYVVLPLSMPGVAAIAIYAGVLAWADFLFARTLITQSQWWTMSVGVVSFVGEYTVNWNGIMAAGLISLLPMAILFVFLERFLVGGLAAGSVKG
jgi:multiple sugar transport system permease protein